MRESAIVLAVLANFHWVAQAASREAPRCLLSRRLRPMIAESDSDLSLSDTSATAWRRAGAAEPGLRR
jgi:hypothetical protein